MLVFTPSLLPPTSPTSSLAMTAATLPSHFISSFSHWRQSLYDSPLTPPIVTSDGQHRKMQCDPQPTTLPPISYLDRHLPAMPPLTPPRLEIPTFQNYSSPSSPMLATPSHQPSLFPSDIHRPPSFRPSPVKLPIDDPPYLVDWLDFTRKRSAHSIAEKTCEMICYLWFSSPPSNSAASSLQPTSASRPNRHISATNTLQLLATPTFVNFMQKLLETTQVSQSVIVLSLHYIYRLKERNRFTAGQPGSEFRIAVAGLMMANKFLDDNTYTNKTWSEVSGIDLTEINRMEREFLMGIDFGLYVDKPTYESWLNLLKGLVMAKDRDSKQWRRSRVLPRATRLDSHPSRSILPKRYRDRARSTSPGSWDLPTSSGNHYYPVNNNPANAEASPRSGLKRSAAAAFSPTTATFANLPSKRPVSMSLVIPEIVPVSGSNSTSHSPLEPLHSFAKMSLGSSPAPHPSSKRAPSSVFVSSTRLDSMPTTLAASYAVDEHRRPIGPQNLYFYSLACSPMENEEESRYRKARLRCHQAPPPTTSSFYPGKLVMPTNVQSASASPHDVHMNVPPSLPHFHDSVWSRRNVPQAYDHSPPLPLPRPQQQQHLAEFPGHSIPSAPFANAGPPGVHFYSTPNSFQRSFPPYANNWTRGRQL